MTGVRSISVMILLAACTAPATSSRAFVPTTGQTVTVDTLRLDVIDVQPTHWKSGVSYYAIVRATDGATTRTITLTDTPTRVQVVNDHAIRLSDHPLDISITPAPTLAIDSVAAERIARAEAAALKWPSLVPSQVILRFGTTWEVSIQLAMDMDGVVEIDAATGRVLSASKQGGF